MVQQPATACKACGGLLLLVSHLSEGNALYLVPVEQGFAVWQARTK